VDSDLAESLQALKEAFSNRRLSAQFGRAEATRVEALRTKLRIPRRFREFLLAADPLDVETRTPAERVRLVPSERLLEEQHGLGLTETGEPQSGQAPNGWRPGWVVVAHSALLGDPYFLDTTSPDAEGDCPVYTAMNGRTSTVKPANDVPSAGPTIAPTGSAMAAVIAGKNGRINFAATVTTGKCLTGFTVGSIRRFT
jgi:hypothetical protein